MIQPKILSEFENINPIKKLHYCWFGYGSMGEKEKKCMASWSRFLPDFEIIRWDESNFDVNCCRYVKEAYEAKKWAFVSDYARFKLLYEYGGLYLDTDVEIVAPLQKLLITPFMGMESRATSIAGVTVNPGLGMYAIPRMSIYKEILDSYESTGFMGAGGVPDFTTVVTRTTEILKRYGLRQEDVIQQVAGVTVYPPDYFNPKDYDTGEICLTNNTHSIHHYSMSWFNNRQLLEYKIRACLIRHGMSRPAALKMAAILMTIRYLDVKRIINHMSRIKN